MSKVVSGLMQLLSVAALHAEPLLKKNDDIETVSMMTRACDEKNNLAPAGCENGLLIKKEPVDDEDGDPPIKTEPCDVSTKKRSRKQHKSTIIQAPSKKKCATWFSGVLPFSNNSKQQNAPSIPQASINVVSSAAKRIESPSAQSSAIPVKKKTRKLCEHIKDGMHFGQFAFRLPCSHISLIRSTSSKQTLHVISRFHLPSQEKQK